MKRIAVTQRLVANDSYVEVRECLDINYSRFLYSCGLLPIALPYDLEFQSYFDELNIEGVFLTGGGDLFSLSGNPLDKKRDDFEKNILSYAINNDIPVFAVCRGLQLIVDYFGGTFKKVNDEVNVISELVVNNSSRYSSHLSKIKKPKSFHNYAVDILPSDLLVSATNSIGVVKAIEHSKYKIFGQMWHSERHEVFNLEEINLIREFYAVK